DTFDGDTYFPGDFDYSKFERVKYWSGVVDDKNKYPHTFEVWKRV
ncbi:MAG TPA: dihydrofolate reductase, partial [Kurthia sp.]